MSAEQQMSTSSTPLLRLSGASVQQAEHLVLKEVELEIREGEFVYLVGKTGSGKSSLLRALYGDLPLAGGTGEVCGVNLSRVKPKNVHLLRRKLGIVFQDFALLPDRTVLENLSFVLKATGWKNRADMTQRMQSCLDAVGLGAKGYKRPHELSGGEQQRVAIARALLNEPSLMLADEPTGNLDPATTEEIMTLLHGLVAQNRSVLMATHDHASLSNYPGRVLMVGKGKVHEV